MIGTFKVKQPQLVGNLRLTRTKILSSEKKVAMAMVTTPFMAGGMRLLCLKDFFCVERTGTWEQLTAASKILTLFC